MNEFTDRASGQKGATMNRLFNLDNPFMQFLNNMADLIILNIIFLLSCIPLVTVGASISALHYVCLKMVRGESPYVWAGFWKGFRESFKQGTILWLCFAAIAAFIGLDHIILNSGDSALFSVMKVALGVVTALLSCIFIYIFPIVSHFKCTTKQAVKNALFMTIGHLPYTVLLAAMYSLIIFLCTLNVKMLAMILMLSVICGFSVAAFTACIIFDRIFRKYEPEREAIPEYYE